MKALLLYGTLTGMTGEIAQNLHDRLTTELPHQPVDLKSVREVTPDSLLEYDKIMFGCSTWDHGIPSPDVEEFLSTLMLQKPDYSSLTFALFGLGDSAYELFCGALPLMEEDLKRVKATIDPTQFTMDGFPNEEVMNGLVDWAKNFLTR